MMALQNSGRSLGKRDVIKLPSTTTGESSYSPLKELRIQSNKREGIIGDYINPGIRQPNPSHPLNETKHYECMM